MQKLHGLSLSGRLGEYLLLATPLTQPVNPLPATPLHTLYSIPNQGRFKLYHYRSVTWPVTIWRRRFTRTSAGGSLPVHSGPTSRALPKT